MKEELDGKKIDDLDLPDTSLVIVVKRGEEFFIPKGNFKILEEDQLTILTEEKNLETLAESFG